MLRRSAPSLSDALLVPERLAMTTTTTTTTNVSTTIVLPENVEAVEDVVSDDDDVESMSIASSSQQPALEASLSLSSATIESETPPTPSTSE